MRRKWMAVMAVITLTVSMMPSMVSAAPVALSPEDVRLSMTVTTDKNGKITSEEYYNEQEKLLRLEEFGDDESGAFQSIYHYDESGEYLLQETRKWYDGTQVVFSYKYDENHQLIEFDCSPSPDGDLYSREIFTYDSQGNVIRSVYSHAEGSMFATEKEYDDNGREILCIYTEKDNFESEPYSWKTVKTYQEIDEYSWTVTTTTFDSDGNEGGSYTESRYYDTDGNLISCVEYNEGELYHITNTYDSSKRLIRKESVMEGEAEVEPYIETFVYRPDGLLKEEVSGYGDDTYTKQYIYSLKPFADVEDTEYFALPVKWAIDEGITAGLSSDTFGPDESCTRAQAVTFLWRAAGRPEPSISTNPFQDVREDDYYYKAVLWAVENGITNGLSEDTFGPEVFCSRGQIVTFLHRSRGEPGLGGTVEFTDVTDGDYYYGAVLWAVADGVTKGTSDKLFSPGDICTRGQIVTFLYRAMLAA